MEHVAFFLKKFQGLGLAETLTKQAFIEIAEKIVGAEVPKRSVTLRNGTLYVSVNPAQKSELFLKRAVIMDELEKRLGAIRVSHLR